MSTSVLTDPRPATKYRTRPRTSPILACEACGTGFVFRKGMPNRFCSVACVNSGKCVHSDKMLKLAAKLWAAGQTVRHIAHALGVKPNVISGLTHRHRDMFPRRVMPLSVRYE